MRSARTGLLAGIAMFGAVGCALLLGIEDKPVLSAADAGDSGPVDPCVHVVPPPPPDTDEEPDTLREFLIATRRLSVNGVDAGVVGLDLDDTCTCAGGPGARHDAAPSCTSVAEQCDGDGGIDNAFGTIAFVDALRGNEFENDEVECGRRTMLLVLRNYNGLANDSSVTIAPVVSPGLDTPHDAGEVASQCNDSGPLPLVYSPHWDGTDNWSSDDSFVQFKSRDPYQFLKGYVRDWKLVARAARTQSVPFPVGPVVMETAQAVFVAEIDPLDDTLKPLERAPGTRASFVNLRGQITARIPVSSVFRAVHNLETRQFRGFLCPDNVVYPAFKSSICGALDLVAAADNDFKGAACDALSLAVAFAGEPAKMNSARAAVPGKRSPCSDVPTTCP
jgi:hypothetical protein